MVQVIFVLTLGLVFGSFLFTMAVRLPAGLSVWRRSACDHCSRSIDPAGLIPILGYLIYRGRCKHCGLGISPVYPAMELLNAVWVYALFFKTGWNIEFVHVFLIFETLFLIAILDFRSYLIFPRPILFGLFVQTIWLFFFDRSEILNSLIGLFLGAGIFHWIGYLYQLLRNRIGLGEGDATLLGLIGYFLGWNVLFSTIFWSAIFGIVGGGLTLLAKKQSLKREIAFGPWLVLAAFLIWLMPEIFQSIPFNTAYDLVIRK